MAKPSEVGDLLDRTFDNLLLTPLPGTPGAALRQQVGYVKANYPLLYSTGKIGEKTAACFTLAREGGITLNSLSVVHDQLFLEAPVSAAAIALWQALTLFCLAAEARIVSSMTFVSRDDVDVMLERVRDTFNTAKDLAADAIDSACYQALNYLSGSLVSHLASTERPLPQMLVFDMPISFPVLTLSNRIYYTADRWEELYAENKPIHPLFCQREIIGLSSGANTAIAGASGVLKKRPSKKPDRKPPLPVLPPEPIEPPSLYQFIGRAQLIVNATQFYLASAKIPIVGFTRVTLQSKKAAAAQFAGGSTAYVTASLRGKQFATVQFAGGSTAYATAIFGGKQFATARFALASSLSTNPVEPPFSLLMHFES